MIKKGRDLKDQNYFSNRVGKKKTPTCLIAVENKCCANAWAREWHAGCFEQPGDIVREPSIVPLKGTRNGA